MNRTQTINFAINTHGFKTYLELGCQANVNFNAVTCAHKIGVDSEQGGTHRMTTDQFFEQNTEKFDIVFIDAYHHHDQVMKDFQNSLLVLNNNGMIIFHDCNPHNERYELQDACGTAWRAFAHIRSNKDLDGIVGEYDYGVGLVRVAPNEDLIEIPKAMNDLTYADLHTNRHKLLRLQTWDGVRNWICKSAIK